MNDPLHPMRAFEFWLTSQPEEIRSQIYYFLFVFFPGKPPVVQSMEATMEPQTVAERWFKDNDGPYHTIGKALHIKAVMDFFIVRRYADPHHWEELQQQNSDIANIIRENGDAELSDKLLRDLKDNPRREVQWMIALDSWNQFSVRCLSAEVLETWMEQQHQRRTL